MPRPRCNVVYAPAYIYARSTLLKHHATVALLPIVHEMHHEKCRMP